MLKYVLLLHYSCMNADHTLTAPFIRSSWDTFVICDTREDHRVVVMEGARWFLHWNGVYHLTNHAINTLETRLGWGLMQNVLESLKVAVHLRAPRSSWVGTVRAPRRGPPWGGRSWSKPLHPLSGRQPDHSRAGVAWNSSPGASRFGTEAQRKPSAEGAEQTQVRFWRFCVDRTIQKLLFFLRFKKKPTSGGILKCLCSANLIHAQRYGVLEHGPNNRLAAVGGGQGTTVTEVGGHIMLRGDQFSQGDGGQSSVSIWKQKKTISQRETYWNGPWVQNFIPTCRFDVSQCVDERLILSVWAVGHLKIAKHLL